MSDHERGEPALIARRFARFGRALGREDHLPIDPDLSPDDPSEPSTSHRPATTMLLHRRDPRVLASIGVGGFIGTAGRYGVGLAWPTAAGAFPAATFAVNTSGAFVLGFLLTLILEHLQPSGCLRPFACVGVLGAWTTMSTLATETDVLLKDGYIAQALAYIAITLAAGVLATVAGIALGGRRVVDS